MGMTGDVKMTVVDDAATDAVRESLEAGVGFKERPSGVLVPSDLVTAHLPRERWDTAKIDLIERVGKFLKQHDVIMLLICTDAHCRDDAKRATLRRVEVGDGVFVLACEHKLRVCSDRKTLKKALRDRRRRGRS
jgi:hypothetical protein